MIILETDGPVTLHRKTGPRSTSAKGKTLPAGTHKLPKRKHGYTVKGEATVKLTVPVGARFTVIAHTRTGRDAVDTFEVLPGLSEDKPMSREVKLEGGMKLSFFETRPKEQRDG